MSKFVTLITWTLNKTVKQTCFHQLFISIILKSFLRTWSRGFPLKSMQLRFCINIIDMNDTNMQSMLFAEGTKSPGGNIPVAQKNETK